MDDGLYWVILLMYGSLDMRHTSFRKLKVVNRTPGFWGVTVDPALERGCPIKGELRLVENTSYKGYSPPKCTCNVHQHYTFTFQQEHANSIWNLTCHAMK